MLSEKFKFFDPELYCAMEMELRRQKDKLELIASENFVSSYVLEAVGSVLTNKCAAGFPRSRFHAGCEYVDIVETLAVERVKKLFGAKHANVQPDSCNNANLAVYIAMLEPGDTILSMELEHGGHSSHGSPVNISGMFYNCVSYGVNPETEQIDYEHVRELAWQHRPKLIIAGGSAYPRTIDFKVFADIAEEVGALLLADMSYISGIIAAGYHQSPIGFADFITSSTAITLHGARGGIILCKEQYGRKIDRAVFPGVQDGPQLQCIAAKAVSFKEASLPDFKIYIRQTLINADAIARGLIDLGYHLVSGGTDTHMLLLDLRDKGITGRAAEEALERAGIIVNRNIIPFDERGMKVTSGIRIGTAAMTTRGMVEKDALKTVELIDMVLSNIGDSNVEEKVSKEVAWLCSSYPIY